MRRPSNYLFIKKIVLNRNITANKLRSGFKHLNNYDQFHATYIVVKYFLVSGATAHRGPEPPNDRGSEITHIDTP